MGNISFLKSKRNVTNLLTTLKSQISNLMSKHFEQIIEEENLSELFTKKNSLNEEEAKYIILCLNTCLLLSLVVFDIFYEKLLLFLENII